MFCRASDVTWFEGRIKKAINCFHEEIKTRALAITRTEYCQLFYKNPISEMYKIVIFLFYFALF
jgi:hypothetical protein